MSILRRRKDLQSAEEITVEPDVPVHTYLDSFGNICGRLLAPAGTVRFTLDTAIQDSGEPDRGIARGDAA